MICSSVTRGLVLWMAMIVPHTPTFARQVEMPDASHVTLDAKVTAVTMYRGRAAVTRSGALTLEPGVYQISIEHLPETVEPDTLQARASGVAKVLSVDFSQQHLAVPPTQFTELDAAIEGLQRQSKDIGEQRELIKAQEQFIDAISAKVAGEAGKEAGTAQLDLDAMRRQLSFIAEERGKLLTTRQELDAAQRTLEKQLHAAQANRNAMAGTSNVHRTAVVTVVAAEGGSAGIELSYLVGNATWEPIYNIRASLKDGTAHIEYDAMLTQRTGEDWDQVRLTLSTAQPSVAANPPSLRPWFVDIVRPREKNAALAMEREAHAPPPGPAGAPVDKADLKFLYADAGVGGEGSAISYHLPRTVTVKSNVQQQQRTHIATISANPKFVHVALPGLTDAVYIRGDLVNASPYQLLPGKAAIFVSQDYVGPTTLASIAPAGEIRLHFGIDPSVKATRQLITKRTENTGLLSGGRRTSYDYRIVIDNGTGKSLALELWDRYPISRAEEIQVEIVDLSHPLANDAKYLAEQRPQGLLKWLLSLPATASGKNSTVIAYGVRLNRAKDVEMTPLPE